jgi:hypothetical protein
LIRSWCWAIPRSWINVPISFFASISISLV